MKYILFIPLVISFFWAQLYLTSSSIISSFMIMLGPSMWGAFCVYMYDFYRAKVKRNSPYMIELYSQIQKDIVLATISGLTFIVFILMTSNKYDFSNVDLAFFGMPFIASSIGEILKLNSKKFFDNKMVDKIKWYITITLLILYAIFFALLVKIIENEFSTRQSVWYQLTIVFTSIFVYFWTSYIRFIFEKKHMEISPVIMEIVSSYKIANSLLAEIPNIINIWNQQIKIEQAAIRKRKLIKNRNKRK